MRIPVSLQVVLLMIIGCSEDNPVSSHDNEFAPSGRLSVPEYHLDLQGKDRRLTVCVTDYNPGLRYEMRLSQGGWFVTDDWTIYTDFVRHGETVACWSRPDFERLVNYKMQLRSCFPLPEMIESRPGHCSEWSHDHSFWFIE